MNRFFVFLMSLTILSCSQTEKEPEHPYNSFSKNALYYRITPEKKFDKSGLMFSDQGAWFAYSFPGSSTKKRFALQVGFTGPFLMTQQNGIWSSKALTELSVKNVNWDSHHIESYSSHLEQSFTSSNVELTQKLVFLSGHTALIQSTLKNTSDETLSLDYEWKINSILADSLKLKREGNEITITSSKTNAVGHILMNPASLTLELKPNESKEFTISQTFIFPEYDWAKEKESIQQTDFNDLLSERKNQKNTQLKNLITNRKSQFEDSIYAHVLAKAQLTLQNNWRIPAGEIKHEGLFPSYHYRWFNGFWSWDSWKHAVGLSHFDLDLAKKQMKLMFEFQNEDGFVADVVYRDTSIERHNYRDTKPPLSAWAVAKIYEKDKDLEFVKYMYPKLKKYHEWWYAKRDHDQDGLCEYGSTDGSLIAAKWESGMDNAIRFDDSKIVKNGEGAYSLDQESVDLNSYLYAEKLFLAELSKALGNNDADTYIQEAKVLKKKVQEQFYDANDGWFYDTNLEGNTFIKGEGSEGWTALWAKAATQEQAEAVKKRMMNPQKFFTKVPFQTMSADHPKFDPLRGYWRGPNWLDQSYFGVKGLRNYGFNTEADKATRQILEGAEGILEEGKPIRENYHPLTGQGLHAKNFSWSAAHIIMLLSK
ncbi:MGH1-like glycoside hydrolase domain-containing protein [Pseudotenacibaculum haliotis]|uniref:Trehalase family glycosidase n=1 Tax=Pseudotenacibaculum haliotis TaxID=1862138 RepID=A0ABW5LX59_9FLAO